MRITKTYIVNLVRRTDKRNHMIKQLQKLSNANIELNHVFYDAIDGTIDDQLANNNYRVAPWFDPNSNKAMTRGEIGCALSHYNIWNLILNSEPSQNNTIDYYMILEDDVILDTTILDKLSNIKQNLDNLSLSFDILYLHRKPFDLVNEISLADGVNLAKKSYWTCGYILTQLGAQKLLATDYINNLIPVDEFIPIMYNSNEISEKSKYINNTKLTCFACNPPLIKLTDNAFIDSETFHSESLTETTSSYSDIMLVYYTGPVNTDCFERFSEFCKIYGMDIIVVDKNVNISEYQSKTILIMRIIISDDCYILPLTSSAQILSYYYTIPKISILTSIDGTIKIGATELFADPINATVMTDTDHLVYVGNMEYTYQHTNSKIKLKNGIHPFIIYGKTSKDYLTLNTISNYTGNGWNYYYGFRNKSHALESELPKIYISVRVKSDISVLDIFDYINYPSNKLQIVIEKHENKEYYETTIQKFLESDCDYYMFIDSNSFVDNPDIIQQLLATGKKVVAPIIRRHNNLWSNFWGAISDSGYYLRSFDYINIIESIKQGLWNVPYITDIFLIKRSILESNPDIYSGNNDPDMNICGNFRKRNIFMFADNQNKYGYLLEPKNDNHISSKEKNITDILDDTYRKSWEKKYLHPNYFDNISDLSKLEFVEIADGIYTFPLFSKKFCDDIIMCANNKNEWSPGKNNHSDPRLGKNYHENVPTVDVQLFQLNLGRQWDIIVKNYIAPIASILYNRYKTKDVNLAFVVKYSADDQANLPPHHDSSTYTVNIALNEGNGIDYIGGGCRFIRQNISLTNQLPGMCCIHPGKLTAYHEGLAISAGTRYILVSFIN